GAAALLPAKAANQTFEGVVRRTADGPPEVLYYDATSLALVTYSVLTDYAAGSTMVEASRFDIKKCGVTPKSVDLVAHSPSEGVSALALVLDHKTLCAVIPDGTGAWTAHPLAAPAVPGGLFGFDPALFGDVDGDGEADIVLGSVSSMTALESLAVYLRKGA